MEEFSRGIRKAIQEYQMISPGELVLAGVSGGPDSLALLHVLRSLQTELDFKLHAAHLDHSLRGEESATEAAWVKSTAAGWGLECTLHQADAAQFARERKISLQDAGHQLRKEFFEKLQKALGAQKIALGHQADDQAETLLIHFLNGAGMEGLSGLLPVSGPYIRPLLFTARTDIEAYCAYFQLEPRRDPSNEKDLYLRNKIRLRLMPWLLEEINPNLRETLNRTARIFWAEEEYLEKMTNLAARECMSSQEGPISIRQKPFLAQDTALQRRLVRLAWRESGGKQGLSFYHVEEVRALILHKQTGKILPLPQDITAEKEYDAVVFYQGEPVDYESAPLAQRPLAVPGNTEIPETRQQLITEYTDELPGQIPPDTIYIPREEAAPPLVVRSRREGDRFAPAGAQKGGKLKEYFIDQKIPRKIRDRIPLLADKTGILWLAGRAASNRVNKISNSGEYIVVRLINTDAAN